MLWGLYSLGFEREANDFFYFVADVCQDEEDMQIMYAVGGEKELAEQTLDHLGGYEDARPVRVAQAAREQEGLRGIHLRLQRGDLLVAPTQFFLAHLLG